jgi:hypothetical protein
MRALTVQPGQPQSIRLDEVAPPPAIADKDWLSRLITRRVSLSRWQEAFELRDGDQNRGGFHAMSAFRRSG